MTYLRKLRKTVLAIGLWLEKANIAPRDERGFSLVESLVAVAILGIGITGAIVALSTGSLTVNAVDQETTAQSLAQSQLAYTKSYPYDATAPYSYPTVDIPDATYNPNPITLPDGYSILVGVSSIPATNNNIQKITVTISRDAGTTLTVEDFKVNR